MSINIEATIRWKGYNPNDLSPRSGKRVWANCENCGNGRWVFYYAYTDLCHKCAMNQPETIKKLSDAANKQWSVPGTREQLSIDVRQSLIDDPSRPERQSESLKLFYKNNPDKKSDISKRNKIIYNTEARKKESRDRILNWRKNNPEKYKESLKNAKLAQQTPEYKEKQRINRLKQKNMPTDGTSIELKMRKILTDNDYEFEINKPLLNICIPDIVFKDKKIIIQCDGDYWHNYPDGTEKDKKQDEILKKNGWQVIRFWECEINNTIEECLYKFEVEYNGVI